MERKTFDNVLADFSSLQVLHALHHSLQIVYTGSRKAAEQWPAAFFATCAKAERHTEQGDRPVSPDDHLNDADAPVAQRVGEAQPIYGFKPGPRATWRRA